MKHKIELDVGIQNVDKANLFLRAVWSEIRKKFGGCAWNFSPILFRDRNQLLLGRFTTEDDTLGTTEVWITYKNKGGINKLIFINDIEDISRIEAVIAYLVNDFEKILRTKILQTTIESTYPLSKYVDTNFATTPINKHQTELRIKVVGYDDVDCNYISKKITNEIIDVIACSTWSKVEYSNDNDEYSKEIILLKQNTYSEEVTFEMNDEKFEKNGIIYLPKKVIEMINKMVEGNTSDTNINKIVTASKLYHTALKLESLRSTFILKDIDIYETLITQYMSSLEVLSMNEAEVKKCVTCGQNIFSISKRVKELLTKVFPLSESKVKELHSLYTDRSKFLHTGKHFSTRSYLGTSIPQLNSSDKIIEHQTIYDNGSIKYGVGMCFDYCVEQLKM